MDKYKSLSSNVIDSWIHGKDSFVYDIADVGDVDLCTYFNPETDDFGYCISGVAKRTRNPDLLFFISDQRDREISLSVYAKLLNDSNACYKISDPIQQNRCLDGVTYNLAADSSDCNSISNLTKRSYCFNELIFKEKKEKCLGVPGLPFILGDYCVNAVENDTMSFDITVCDTGIYKSRGEYHLACVAYFTGNSSICGILQKNYPYSPIPEECYNYFANERQNPGYCFKQDEKSDIRSCLSLYLGKDAVLPVCSNISDNNTRYNVPACLEKELNASESNPANTLKDCVDQLADEFGLENGLSVKGFRNKCAFYFGVKRRNETYCSELPDSEYKKLCYLLARMEVVD
ncbi:MAG: hypothetical protein GF334_00540 [Candidatus Altiarchaeales archaeon]|nr:hypothetical protein [Candidatus Altiarchaeales archaeon]